MRIQQVGDWVPGSVVRVFSRRHGVWHFGILAANGWVYHASKDRGMFVLTTFAEFAENQSATYTWKPANYESQQLVLVRAHGQLGNKFDLLTANCEDYVNWIVAGVARSPQREAATGFALIGALAIGILCCL
jgi:hypothetical protein